LKEYKDERETKLTFFGNPVISATKYKIVDLCPSILSSNSYLSIFGSDWKYRNSPPRKCPKIEN
jgi:hypothetical protein